MGRLREHATLPIAGSVRKLTVATSVPHPVHMVFSVFRRFVSCTVRDPQGHATFAVGAITLTMAS